MSKKEQTRKSKFISLVLRHKPEEIGLTLDANGFANVSELINGMNKAGTAIDVQELEDIVKADSKGRYELVGDKIRAVQGHSIEVDLELQPSGPPEKLYHGTVAEFLDAISSQGLLPMSRQYVHLSASKETAKAVGERRGQAIIFEVDAEKMQKDGYVFFVAKNGVWLTKHVPPKYLKYRPVGRVE